MQATGYSGKTISEKLGIDQKVRKNSPKMTSMLLIAQPEGYEKLLGKLTGVVKAEKSLDILQFFTKSIKELEREFPRLAKLIISDGFLWISWPKGGSKIETDLNENIVREIGLENRMVDVKVIAIDSDWSALKFVFRVSDRGLLANSKNSS